MTDIAQCDLDIAPRDLDIALAILAEHAPECEARVFGSRADGTAREFSDIDIALVGDAPLGRDALGVVKEAFQESDMHIRADVLDWHSLSDSFKEIVSRNYIVIQRPAQARAGLPAGWRETTLGDVVDLRISNVDKKTKAGERPVRLCNYTDVYKNALISADMDFMEATATEREIAKCGLIPGDVIITKDSEQWDDIGVPALVRESAPDLVCGYHLAILRPLAYGIDGAYLNYALNTREVQHQFHSYANGITRFSLRKGDIEQVEIPLPPLPEQRRIAGMLGALDDKIALNRRMSATLEGMAQALFRMWFVEFEPVRAKMSGRWRRGESPAGMPAELWDAFPARLAAGEVGEAPEGWGMKTLDDELAELVSGQRPRGGAVKSGVPSVGAENVLGLGQYNFGSEKYVPEDFYARLQSRGADIRNGDVLLYKDGAQLGRKTYFDRDFPHPDCAVNEHVFILRLRNPAAQRYLYFWLDQPWMTREIAELNSNSAQPGINRAAVRGLPLLMPSAEVLAAFDEIAGALTDRIFVACHESRALAGLRDALLPRVVAGEARVS